MEAMSLRFAEVARSLGRAGRLIALDVPTFRSPPGLLGVQRTIRRRGDKATISVVVRERPWGAVIADIARSALWLAVDSDALAA